MKIADLPDLKVKTIRAYDVARNGPSAFELALQMREKLSTPEGRATYAKRFQVSEGVFAAVKGLRAGCRFLRTGLERVQEE